VYAGSELEVFVIQLYVVPGSLIGVEHAAYGHLLIHRANDVNVDDLEDPNFLRSTCVGMELEITRPVVNVDAWFIDAVAEHAVDLNADIALPLHHAFVQSTVPTKFSQDLSLRGRHEPQVTVDPST